MSQFNRGFLFGYTSCMAGVLIGILLAVVAK